MNTSQLLIKEFESGNLLNIFHDKIKPGSGPGIDGTSVDKFEKEISYHINTINRKIAGFSYNFSPYKTKLISKGPYKFPRKIAKPTIRDKVVLRALYNILIAVYSEQLEKRTLHKQIGSAIKIYKSKSFNHILRFDVKDFFPSLNHDILLKTLRKKIRSKRLLYLITGMLKTPFNIDKQEGKDRAEKGVAQGLSIASTLANIYLFEFDNKYEGNQNIMYFRYIDDILVFCNIDISPQLKIEIINDLNKLKLIVHDNEKFDDISITEPFDFLGYSFSNYSISVRRKSFQKILDSIIQILSTTRGNNKIPLERVLFRLNLRITGCIYNNKKYGWLFFFSQIENTNLLGSIDHVLRTQLTRYKIERNNVKSFMKSWYQIKYNLNKSSYIPNFDKYSQIEKQEVVKLFIKNRIPDELFDDLFSKIIFNETSRLERDMSDLS